MLKTGAGSILGLCVLASSVLAGCESRHEAAKPPAASASAGAEASQDSAMASMSASESASSVEVAAIGRLGQKPGLWQLTQSLPQMGGSYKQKICVSAKQGATLAVTGQDFLGKPEMARLSCTVHTVRKQDDGADIDSVCEVNDTTLTSNIHVDIIGHDAYHQTAETRYSPAFAGHGDLVTITDGKWLGDCPANMKPGDFVTQDGVHMKVGPVLAKFSS